MIAVVLFFVIFWIWLFEDKEIDGEMLLQADQSVFDELSINSLRKNALLNKYNEDLKSQVFNILITRFTFLYMTGYQLSMVDF